MSPSPRLACYGEAMLLLSSWAQQPALTKSEDRVAGGGEPDGTLQTHALPPVSTEPCLGMGKKNTQHTGGEPGGYQKHRTDVNI